jgi:hypothetical protein
VAIKDMSDTKKYIWRTLLALTLTCCWTDNFGQNSSSDSSTQKSNNEDSLFVEPEVVPSFKGGEMAYIKFLDENLNKVIVGDSGLTAGKVYISFTIDTLGQASNFKVKRSYNRVVDAEFLRVLKLMPNWVPGEIYLNNMSGPWRKKAYEFTLPLKIPHYNLNN